MNLSHPQYERLYQKTHEALVADVTRLSAYLDEAYECSGSIRYVPEAGRLVLLRTQIPLVLRVARARLQAFIEYRTQLFGHPRRATEDTQTYGIVFDHHEHITDVASLLIHAILSTEVLVVLVSDLTNERHDVAEQVREGIRRVEFFVQRAERQLSVIEDEDDEKDDDSSSDASDSGGGSSSSE